VRVERARSEAGVKRCDYAGMSHIIRQQATSYQPKNRGVFYMKTVQSIVDQLVAAKLSTVTTEATSKKEPPKKAPVVSSGKSYSHNSGNLSRAKGPATDRFVGFSGEEVKRAGVDQDKPVPKRKPFVLFPDSESLEWDLLEAEEVRRADTFDTWIERIGYADLHPKHDDAVYNIAARIFLRKKRLTHTK
jgi:hypothetical protein